MSPGGFHIKKRHEDVIDGCGSGTGHMNAYSS